MQTAFPFSMTQILPTRHVVAAQPIDVFTQTVFPLTTLHVEPKEQRTVVQRGISKKETNRISQIVLYIISKKKKVGFTADTIGI